MSSAFGGRVLDTTALLDVAGGVTLYLRALVRAAQLEGITLVVPAVALQAAWAASTPAGRLFVDDLLGLGVTLVEPLDGPGARAAADPIGDGGRWTWATWWPLPGRGDGRCSRRIRVGCAR